MVKKTKKARKLTPTKWKRNKNKTKPKVVPKTATKTNANTTENDRINSIENHIKLYDNYDEKQIELQKNKILNLSFLTNIQKPKISNDDLNRIKSNYFEAPTTNEDEITMNNNNNNNNNTSMNNDDITMDLSLMSNNYKPGINLDLKDMPERLGKHKRGNKKPEHTHPIKLTEFHPKQMGYKKSIYYKNEKLKMKEIEQQLRDEITAEKNIERIKAKQRRELKEKNRIKGLIVTPIRNMAKLKKFNKKQMKTVIKMSVSIKKPRIQLRNTTVNRHVV